MMEYTMKAHPTFYDGVQFRSRLEARWAAFFDQICPKRGSVKWQYEPLDLFGWSPDFRINVPWDPDDYRSFWVEVKPYYGLKNFKDHISEQYIKRIKEDTGKQIFVKDWLQADGILQLGADPLTSRAVWQFVEICDRPVWLQNAIDENEENVEQWRDEPEWGYEEFYLEDRKDFLTASYVRVDEYWKRAGNLTQWKN